MKLALLADIHGNYVALKECLKYIEDNYFDGIIFLGDFVTDCPYPERVIKLLKKTIKNNKTYFVRGNREEYLINYHKSNSKDWKYSSHTGSLLYTYENLTENDIKFFENMPITDLIEIKDCLPFNICHGSPDSTNEILLANKENSDLWLEKIETDYLFCGHSHKPFIYKHNEKFLVNCGSIGMPTNGQINSQFTAIEFLDNHWKIDIVSLPYNIEEIISDFDESGIYNKGFWWSRCIVKTLQTGINYTSICLEEALKIAASEKK